MKTRSLISVVLMTLALVSCRGRESSLTGAYGSAVVAGQVIMGGELAGVSPAGVQVSVVGTGMMTTLGDDGRFSFTGIPRAAELQFVRSDGVYASLRLDGNSPLVVELTGKAVSARRRAAKPKPDQQYEGIVRSVGTDKIVVYTSHKEEIEFSVNDATVIRKGNQLFELADLQPGWRVHVKAQRKDDLLVATEIKVQNPGDDDEDRDSTMNANGRVTSIDPLKVSTQSHGEVTVQTDDNTVIKRQGERITVDQIEVGWEINAHGTRVDDHTLLARQIEVRGNSKKR